MRTLSGRIGVGVLLAALGYGSAAGCVGDSSGSSSGANDAGQDAGTTSDGASPNDTGSDAGGVSDGSSWDAATDADAGPRCDPGKPFANKHLLDNINSSAQNDGVRLTADEKTAYFSRLLAPDAGVAVGGWDIYVATRASTQDPFSIGLPLNGGNTVNDESFPAVTSNGLFAYVASAGDILVGSRATTNAPFTSFVPLTGIASAEYEGAPYVLGDQSALYFEGDHAAGVGGRDLYRASHLGGGVFAAPQLVPGVNTTDYEGTPVVTSDERTIYFAKKSGSWDYDVYVARRPSTASAFGQPQVVTEISSAIHDYPTWVSDDDCVIVWTSTAGTGQVYVAERPK